jgi:periplasmic copper chaperone A
MSVRSALRRACAAGVSGVVATAALAVPASAHVTVTSPDAQPGGRGTLVFRVPTESDTARTVKLTVTLPKDHPFARVSARVKPGWTSQSVETALPAPVQVGDVKISKAVSTLTWTSSGQDIPPGMYDEFVLSVSPLPEGVDTLNFPVDQTYSDGKVVKWNEPVPASGAEPEHPAPQLKLVAASNDPAPAAATADDSSDTLARLLGAAGLVLGLAALVFAIRRTPQRPSSPQ